MAELVGKVNLADLEALQPEAGEVLVGGEIVEVKQFKFMQMLKAMKPISRIINIFIEIDAKGTDATMNDFLGLFAEHTEDVVTLMVLSTNKPREFFDDIEATEGIDLVKAMYEINKSFFEQSLMPKIRQLIPDIVPSVQETPKAKIKKTGSTSSKN